MIPRTAQPKRRGGRPSSSAWFSKSVTKRFEDRRYSHEKLGIISRANSIAMMRVLLRDSKTRKYLGTDHRWTADPSRAQDFHSGWDATDFAFTLNPQRLVIVYQFGDERYDIGIPAQRIPPKAGRPSGRKNLRIASRRLSLYPIASS